MKNKLINFFKSETGLYLIFGTLTTLINYIVFLILSLILGYKYVLITNTVSFVVAVIFAYITNKIYVFHSKDWSSIVLFKEIVFFFSARVFSYFVEQIGLYLSAEVWHLENFKILFVDGIIISKLFLSFLVIVLNWIFSKFFVFKKK